MKTIVPPYLVKGDIIGVTCPAGYMSAIKAEACITTLQNWGYEVMVGKTLGSESDNYFSGSDEERLGELQAMLDDRNIKAILFGRGGYGVSRIVDKINFSKFKKNPKWLIGFSDITVLHCHLISKYHVSSLHGPMAAAFNDGENNNQYILALKNVLAGKKIKYGAAPFLLNRKGTTTGKLVGGNLSLFVNMIGSPSEIDTKGCILFLEDLGEYLYGVDRMLQQLKRSGKLDKLKGLVFGGFTEMKDTERPFGKTMDEILSELIKDYDYPVCFHFPVSHQKENYSLKVGLDYELKITPKKVSLKEV